MSDVVDVVIAYKFVRHLSTPFEEWDAFKVGLIDKDGKRLRKTKTPTDKLALPGWKNLIRNIKVFLEKLPFGKTKLGSFAAALWLIKEETGITDIKILEDEMRRYLDSRDMLLTEHTGDIINTLAPGKYIHGEHILYVKDETSPVAVIFGESVFVLPEIVTKQEHVVAWTDLIKA